MSWKRVLFLPLLFLLSSDWGWLVDFYLFNWYKCFTINRQTCSMYLANKTRDPCQLPANFCHTSPICTAKEQLQLPWKDFVQLRKNHNNDNTSTTFQWRLEDNHRLWVFFLALSCPWSRGPQNLPGQPCRPGAVNSDTQTDSPLDAGVRWSPERWGSPDTAPSTDI